MKADHSQKPSDEAESAGGLGPDLTASVETTNSEQSSSSSGSTSSSDQPIYFRYINPTFTRRLEEITHSQELDTSFCATNNETDL